MNSLIQKATVELAGFLSRQLPALREDWWQNHVEDRLSFQQQRIVEERGFTTLEQLDFAGLLQDIERPRRLAKDWRQT